MKTLRIQCPHCGGHSRLYLASNPLILVLNCPDCQATLLHSEGETFKVDSTKIVNMKHHEIKKYIRELKGDESTLEPSLKKPNVNKGAQKLTANLNSRLDKSSREIPINGDDLVNLKIDLESSTDVLDFIEKL